MTDLATLGLAIDSSQAVKAAKDLDNLSESGKNAEESLGGVEQAARMGGTSTAGYTKALGDAYGVTGNLNKAQVNTIRNLEDQISRTQLSGAALAQYNALRKAGTTAETEAGAVIAGLAARQYDLEHASENAGDRISEQRVKFRALSEAAAVTNSQLGGILGQFGQLTIGSQHLTPGIIAGTIALGAMAAIAAKVVSTFKELAGIGDIAGRTGIAASTLGGIGTSGGFAGLDPAKMTQDMLGFSHAVDESKQGLGSLATLLRANGVTVSDTEDALFKVADLVKNASSDAAKFSIVQQAGLPATREMVKYLEQGGDSLKQQVKDATALTGAYNEQVEIAKKLDDIWNHVSTTISSGIKGGIIAVAEGWRIFFQSVGDIKSLMTDTPGGQMAHLLSTRGIQLGDSSDIYKAVGIKPNTPANNTVDPQALQKQIALEQQRIGILGNMASVDDQVLAKEKEIQVARLNGVSISSAEEDKIKQITRDRVLGIEAIRQQIDASKLEADNIGMSAGQMATYNAVQNRMNQAKRDGQILTTSEIDQIKREADALGVVTQRTDDLKFEYDTFKGTMVEFGQNLRNGSNAWDSFGKAAFNALGKIADKLMGMAADNLWKAAFPTGGSGFFGSLFGGNSAAADASNPALLGNIGPLQSANGNVFMNGLSSYSNSIVTKPTMFAFANGMGIMGEGDDPEAIIPLKRGSDGKLGVSGGGRGGGDYHDNRYFDFRGVDPSMRAFVMSQIRASQKQTLTAAPSVVAKANSNTPNLLKS